MSLLVRVLEWERRHSRFGAHGWISVLLPVLLLLWILFRESPAGAFGDDPVLLVLVWMNLAWMLGVALWRTRRSRRIAIDPVRPVGAGSGLGDSGVRGNSVEFEGTLERGAEAFSRLSAADWRLVEERFRAIQRDPTYAGDFWYVPPNGGFDSVEGRDFSSKRVEAVLEAHVRQGDVPFFPPYDAYKASYRFLWSFVIEPEAAREAVPVMRYPFSPFLRGGACERER